MPIRRHRRNTPLRTAYLALAVAALFVAATLGLAAARAARSAPPGRRAFHAARERLAAGDVEAAVRLADLAFSVQPDSPDAATLSALARASAGDLATAIQRLETAARRSPADPSSALQAGLALRRLARAAPGEAPEAVRLTALAGGWLEEAARRGDAVKGPPPLRFRARVAAACARLAQGGHDEAIRRATELQPATDAEREEAAVVHAAALAAAGRLHAAEQRIAPPGAGTLPDSPRIRTARARLAGIRRTRAMSPLTAGLAAAAAGDAPRASEHLGLWLDEHPADPVALAALAEALARTGDIGRAAARIDRLSAAPGHVASVPFFRGLHLLATGHPAEAQSLLDAAAATAPRDPQIARARLGAMLERLAAARDGACREAVCAEIESSVRDAPADPIPRVALGAAAEMSGDVPAAEKWYRSALDADPACGLAANNLAWLLAVQRRRPADALPFAEEAVRRCPLSAQARDTRGWVRHLAGDLPGAESDLAAARAALPGDADIAIRHARVLAALGRDADARRVLTAVANRQPTSRTRAAFVEAAAACGLGRNP